MSIETKENKINEISKEEENKNDIEGKKELTNDEALDIQINYLKTSTKNILNTIIQNEPDPMSINYKKEFPNNNLDEGILLYLQNVHNKHYRNEIIYILNSINCKLSYINDKNKEYLQNKKFVEREINTISQEKIDYFNEKENLDKELELLTLNAKQNSFMYKTEPSINMNLSTNIINTNADLYDIEIEQKTKKLENLKKKYNKIFDYISANKKEFPIIKNKNSMIQGENMVLNEKLKQKQLIWDQLRRENEKIKTVVIKRDYSHIEPEKKNIKKEEKGQNKNLKVSKISSFLNNMLGKKKK